MDKSSGACLVAGGPQGAPAEPSISGTIRARGEPVRWRALEAGAGLFSSGLSALLITSIGCWTAAPGKLFAAEWAERRRIDEAEEDQQRALHPVGHLVKTERSCSIHTHPTAVLWHVNQPICVCACVCARECNDLCLTESNPLCFLLSSSSDEQICCDWLGGKNERGEKERARKQTCFPGPN